MWLKLRRSNVIFLCRLINFSGYYNFTYALSLMKPLQQKNHLIMYSLHTSRFSALVLVLSLILIYLDLRKNLFNDIESLGQACIRFSSHVTYSSSWIFWHLSQHASCHSPNIKTSPLLQSCELVWHEYHVPNVNQVAKVCQDQEGALALAWDAYEACDFVTAVQYVVNTLDTLQSGFWLEAPQNWFSGGAIFHDAGIGLIWAENQVLCWLKNGFEN